ncbi:uncharacterized protein LOC144450952 [Glandiceps talaboti]
MGCGSSSSTQTDSNNKPEKKDKKKGDVEQLDIKQTGIEDLDTMFDDASAPFNKAVDVKGAFDEAVEKFKALTGHTKDDSIKDVMLDLKKKFPQLKLEVQEGPKFVLTTGDGEGEDVADLAEKAVEAFTAISDLVSEIIELMKTAVESAQGLIEKAQEIEGMVKNAGLSPLKIPKALKNAVHNVTEFKKVPPIGEAFKKTIEDIVEDIKKTAEALTSEP